MALSKDILKAQAVLAGLTDAQLDAVVTLSSNDETIVIGNRIGTLHGQYDTDVLEATGIAKAQGEKSYDYVKRVLKEFKDKAASVDTIKTELDTVKGEKAALETKIKEGSGDAHIKQQLLDTEKRANDLQKLLDDEKANAVTEKTKLEKDLFSVKINTILDKELGQLKFKATIPESVKQVLIENAKAKLTVDSKPEFTTVNGKEVLVFRDATGNILNNQANGLNPFTASELLGQQLRDALEVAIVKPGAGTTKPTVTVGSTALDISGARSQVEADEMIETHLLQTGLTRTSEEFAAEQTKIRTELAVDKLPTRVD